ncbi:hypothetical protein HHK36_020204 [Tetracentron sinense]|uniref:GST N-terminal domain-containing protein n=1 Tax=Tetracentron sinense TaxID=13715 RepID=A0A834YT78_TETSI|nr:hypothetical protein HHK36_020204 [Tetracentron sinense]
MHIEDPRDKSPMPVNKEIPLLVHHEKAIADSLVILEYIEDTWKHNPILPQNPYERAKPRYWGKFADEEYGQLTALRDMNKRKL